jgi:diguanylate cyclase (GGDEF)-like protein/PAS domain S-box-containing protein
MDYKLPGHNMPEKADAKPRVLVADDEPHMRHSLQQLLGMQGYDVDVCDNGKTAVMMLESQIYDLVLLDLHMPGMNGYAVLDNIVASKIAATVIVVSGDTAINAAIHALRCGAYDFLRKPYEPEELLKTVENALHKRYLENKVSFMNQRLDKSEKWHRYLVDNSPDIIYTLDAEGRFSFLNQRATDLLGYTKDQLMGKHYTMVVHPEDVEHAKHVCNERRTGGRAATNIELRLLCRPSDDQDHKGQPPFLTVEVSAMGIYDGPQPGGVSHFFGTYGVAKDVSERKQAEEMIYHQAYHDMLTGLPNRLLFKDHLVLAMAQAKRSRTKLAVMFLDLDRFKIVNDTMGHVVGDQLLQSVAMRLSKSVREGDTLARQGGDEFTLLLPQIDQVEDAANAAAKLLATLTRPFRVGGQDHYFSASIGIAIYPDDGDSVDSLVKNADIAMYHVKEMGRNNFAFFSQAKSAVYSHRMVLENDLRRAVANNEFELHYQPQLNTQSGVITGMEALIRWNHPERGLLAPAEFIPLAEESGMIGMIGDWVLKAACNQAAHWRSAGLPPVRMAVNVSAQQIEQHDFLDKVKQVLQDSGLESSALDIEITESAMMNDIDNSQEKLRQLAKLGVQISIDDFGTGYSSLSYLKDLPITAIKIDQSFIRDLAEDYSETSIVTAMIQIAKGLKLKLIAEGVEQAYQLEFLRKNNCEECQGYLFSRPVNAKDATHMLGQPAGSLQPKRVTQ